MFVKNEERMQSVKQNSKVKKAFLSQRNVLRESQVFERKVWGGEIGWPSEITKMVKMLEMDKICAPNCILVPLTEVRKVILASRK